MSHADYGSVERKLISKYNLQKPQGVTNLFEDIHKLREQRFRGTDTTLLSSLLVDLERLHVKSELTERQLQAIWYKYELDLPQGDVAEIMGISQQAVSKHLNRAIARMVIVAKEEEANYERNV